MKLNAIAEAGIRWHNRISILRRYENDPDVFCSFTALNKLGINPATKFIPPGVYAYPLEYVLRRYNPDYASFYLPLASSEDYLHVFRPKQPERILHLYPGDDILSSSGPTGEYPYERWFLPKLSAIGATVEQYQEAKRALFQQEPDPAWPEFMRQYQRVGHRPPRVDTAVAFETIGRLVGWNGPKWSLALLQLGAHGAYDHNTGTLWPLTEDGHVEAVFFSPVHLQRLETVFNGERRRSQMPATRHRAAMRRDPDLANRQLRQYATSLVSGDIIGYSHLYNIPYYAAEASDAVALTNLIKQLELWRQRGLPERPLEYNKLFPGVLRALQDQLATISSQPEIS